MALWRGEQEIDCLLQACSTEFAKLESGGLHAFLRLGSVQLMRQEGTPLGTGGRALFQYPGSTPPPSTMPPLPVHGVDSLTAVLVEVTG